MATGGSGQRVDEATLRYLADVLATQREVAKTSLFPATKQESLVVNLDTQYYPTSIEGVRLEIRSYTNGDFHVSYFENYLGDRRRCRWDRHDQDHSTRDHFHPLPAARTDAAQDRSFPADVIATLETVVLPWLDGRLGDLWNELG